MRQTTPSVPYAGVVMDEATRTLRGPFGTVPLTRTEWQVLMELSRHCGEIVDRKTLLERVWDGEYR